MEDKKTSKKNHWTQTKVNDATKKINQEIYKRNRQAPINIKMDDMSIYINDIITRRGIAKGLVSIQEDLNKNILIAEKNTLYALIEMEANLSFDELYNAYMLCLKNKKRKKGTLNFVNEKLCENLVIELYNIFI